MREVVIGNVVRLLIILITTWLLISFDRYPDFETYSLIAYATPLFFPDGLRRAKGLNEMFYNLVQIVLAFTPLLIAFPGQILLVSFVIAINVGLKTYVVKESHPLSDIIKANFDHLNADSESDYLKEEK